MTPGEQLTDHHVCFPAKNFQTRLEKKLRRHRGMIVPAYFAAQSDLHRNMPDFPKPSRDDMSNLLRILNETGEEFKTSPFWGLYKAIEYFEHQRDIEQHLVTQLGYVALGLGEIEERRLDVAA